MTGYREVDPVARVVKNPDVRKREIVDAAMDLFSRKGYEKTTIDDIVAKVGVAKGLFYYYYKTKDDLLPDIMHRYQSEMVEALKPLEDSRLSTIEKFKMLITLSSELKRKRSKLLAFAHAERNRFLHNMIAEEGIDLLVPILEDIIRQGVREGIFDVKYPRETAKVLLVSINAVGHDSLKALDSVSIKRYMDFTQELMERLLGSKKGTLDFIKGYVPNAVKFAGKLAKANRAGNAKGKTHRQGA